MQSEPKERGISEDQLLFEMQSGTKKRRISEDQLVEEMQEAAKEMKISEMEEAAKETKISEMQEAAKETKISEMQEAAKETKISEMQEAAKETERKVKLPPKSLTLLAEDEIQINEVSEDDEREEESVYENWWDRLFCPDGVTKPDYELWDRYRTQVNESQGFDIDVFPGNCGMCGLIVPIVGFNDDTKLLEDVERCSKAAIKKFNDEEDAAYEFDKVEKVNSMLCAGFVYFITFHARDASVVPPLEEVFQARVFDAIDPDQFEVGFCIVKKKK